MTGVRRARACPWRTHVEEPDGTIWIKVNDGSGMDWRDQDGNQLGDYQIDQKLAHGSEIVVYSVDLETEEVDAFSLSEGEYVVLPFGFWAEGAGDEDRWIPGPDTSTELWRLAGWTWHGPRGNATAIFDAPDRRLAYTNLLMDADAGWERRAVEMYVDPTDKILVVLPGQEHETWDDQWDWTDEFGESVGPPPRQTV